MIKIVDINKIQDTKSIEYIYQNKLNYISISKNYTLTSTKVKELKFSYEFTDYDRPMYYYIDVEDMSKEEVEVLFLKLENLLDSGTDFQITFEYSGKEIRNDYEWVWNLKEIKTKRTKQKEKIVGDLKNDKDFRVIWRNRLA